MLQQVTLLKRRPICMLIHSRLLPSLSSSIHLQRTLPSRRRQLSTSTTPISSIEDKPPYAGPLTSTFRRLKIFSLSSLTLSCTLAPFMFIVESNLPLTARFALATIAIGTSGMSTALVAWCGKPYVTTLRRLRSEADGSSEEIELTTLDLFLRPKTTRIFDPAFLVETKRPFAKWELANSLVLPTNKPVSPGHEETVAETTGKDGNTVGRWVVTWGEHGEGTCREVGRVIQHFNVHEELLQ